jgi:hypothetical protein
MKDPIAEALHDLMDGLREKLAQGAADEITESWKKFCRNPWPPEYGADRERFVFISGWLGGLMSGLDATDMPEELVRAFVAGDVGERVFNAADIETIEWQNEYRKLTRDKPVRPEKGEV